MCDSGVSGTWEPINGTAPAPTVTEYNAEPDNDGDGDDSGDSGDSGNNTDKVYKYTVSGAGTESVDGNYFDTGISISGYPSYMKDGTENDSSASVILFNAGDRWAISFLGITLDQLKTSSSPSNDVALYSTAAYVTDSTNITDTWSIGGVAGTDPVPTVTEYNTSPDSGGDTVTRNYVYTMSGAGSDIVNGNYYDTGEVFDDFPVYRNDNGIYFFHSHGQGWWNVTDIAPADFAFDASVNCYYGWGYNALPNMEIGAADVGYGTWITPAPTLTEYSTGSGGTDSSKTYAYTASGFNDGTTDGDYYLTDLTYDDHSVYSNGTMYLYFGDHFGNGQSWALSEFAPGTGAIKYYRNVGEDLIGTNTWQAELGSATIVATIVEY